MFLFLNKKFRSFFAAYPLVGVLLLVVAISAVLATIDLWRMRHRTPKN